MLGMQWSGQFDSHTSSSSFSVLLSSSTCPSKALHGRFCHVSVPTGKCSRSLETHCLICCTPASLSPAVHVTPQKVKPPGRGTFLVCQFLINNGGGPGGALSLLIHPLHHCTIKNQILNKPRNRNNESSQYEIDILQNTGAES